MSSDSDSAFEWRLLLPAPVRRLPADLAAVVAVVVVTDLVVLLPGVSQTLLRVVAVPFVLLTPGYALVSALFPEAPDARGERERTDRRLPTLDTASGMERAALSFGASVVVVAFLGLVLALSPWGVRIVPSLVAISAVTLLTTAVAASRRRVLPPDERFSVSADRWLSKVRVAFLEPESRSDAVVNVVLAATLLLATASVAYAVAIPSQGEPYTEFSLLSENETGELVAAGPSVSFAPNETNSVHVAIGNHEHRQMDYVVVATIQRVEVQNGSVRVRGERELTRVRASVGANETWMHELNVTPDADAERLRLVVLLYRNDAPADPSAESAYRTLRLLEESPENESASARAGGHLVPPA